MPAPKLRSPRRARVARRCCSRTTSKRWPDVVATVHRGIREGHLVKEIDALAAHGCARRGGIQFAFSIRPRALRCARRAPSDRLLYKRAIRSRLEKPTQPHSFQRRRRSGAGRRSGPGSDHRAGFASPAARFVLTTGTFLSADSHRYCRTTAQAAGDPPSISLAAHLRELSCPPGA